MSRAEKGCSCGLPAGNPHPEGWSDEFGGVRVVHDAGYEAAHGSADYHRATGYEARVFYDPGCGWSVQVRGGQLR